MNFIFPILAAVFQAGSYAIDKNVLSLRRVSFKTYASFSFPLIFLITLLIFIIFQSPLSFALFKGFHWLFVLILMGITIADNLIFYRALDNDRLEEIQTINLLPVISVIIFSSLIFTDERKLFIIIPALIASLAVIWSHFEKHHFKIKKYTLPFLVWALIAAPFKALMLKILLFTWHPVSLQLVISGGVALGIGLIISKHFMKIPKKAFLILAASNVLTSIAWILFYFSYQVSGIIYTVLIFSLQPLLVYLASIFFLKEPLQWKKAVAFAIVLISIVAARIIE
jgi:drug/metabolite transporter (DMT)-like permease